MSENTGIQWTHHTFNPWSGCAKVAPECDNCYAAASPPARRRFAEWGAETARAWASDAYWRDPWGWARAAGEAGERRRVFCGSMCDIAEQHPDPATNKAMNEARFRVFNLIARTPELDWLLLTKRAANLAMHLRAWRESHGFNTLPTNLWVGASAGTQASLERQIGGLLSIPARVRFLSMEPLLEPVSMAVPFVLDGVVGRLNPVAGIWLHPDGRGYVTDAPSIQWVIVGGESGKGARPFPFRAAQEIVQQCLDNGVPVFVKQLGTLAARTDGLAHKKGGDPDEWPESLRVRQFPSEVSDG